MFQEVFQFHQYLVFPSFLPVLLPLMGWLHCQKLDGPNWPMVLLRCLQLAQDGPMLALEVDRLPALEE
jgi:hypothetical protein